MRLIGLFAVIVALAFAPAALADSSTLLEGYGTSGSKPVVQVKGTQSSTPKPKPVRTPTAPKPAPTATPAAATNAPAALPFTGSDLGVFAVVGAGLIALGFGLRRLGRRD